MFSVLKFLWMVCTAFPGLLNVDRNALKNVPDPTKYLSMVMLSCFWCLAFGLYIGELLTIGYNMIGHIAIVTMVFVTWRVFKGFTTNTNTNSRQYTQEYLRAPDRGSRCDEYTDEWRKGIIAKLDSK